MRITLVNSEYIPYESLSFGFCVVVSTLKENGIEPNIIDYNYLKKIGDLDILFSTHDINQYLYFNKISVEMETALDKISSLINTEIVGFSCFSFESLKQSLLLAKYIKSIDPNKKIIFGGIGTFNHEQELMNDFSFIDFIVMKKGEHQFCELIKNIKNKKSFKKIPNLVFRNKYGVTKLNKIEGYNIDSQLCPNYDFYYNIKKDLTLQYMTSEGCVNKCRFCGLTNKKPQYKRVSKVINEIKHLKARYNCNQFCFQDDNINTNHKRTIVLMDALKIIDVEWYALASANLMTKKIIKKMSEAGCRWIQFGLESGSKRVLKLMNKPVNLKKFEQIMALCNQVNIQPQVNIIMGYPGETESDVEQTLKYLYDNHRNYSHVNLMLFRLYFDSFLGHTLKTKYKDPTTLKKNIEKYNYFINIDNMQHINKYVSFLEKYSIPYNSVFKPKNE